MKKYLLTASLSLQEYFTYRINFLLWRMRLVISVLISYSLWDALFQNTNILFDYKENQMLTYILMTIFISGIVFSTQTFRVGEEINRGILSNYLIRPINYFFYNLSRDLSDKLVNTVFCIFEFIFLLIILKPPVIIQSDILILLYFFGAIVAACILYFEISILLSFIGFWSQETWAPRFLFFIVVAFLAGNYFPLDIVPPRIYTILEILPFTYLTYFPLKIYLGKLSTYAMIKGTMFTIIWIIIFYFLMLWVWRKGLKTYTSEGQ